MSGLPKLPGYNFFDPTLTKYHLSHTFDYINGYKIPKLGSPGIGGRELDINSVAHIESNDPVRYDPSLTYGRTRSAALPQYLPHFALYDQKCLTFKAFFKQSVVESPLEYYRVRKVNIIYFLEDDTITIMEPRIRNSGLEQGRLVRRGKIPKNNLGNYWHWKDLQVGKDIAINGVVYHTTDCDLFTREFMRSQGLIMGDPEEIPPDPYTQVREWSVQVHETTTPAADDKLRRFLEYDGKVLNFNAVWDTRDEEFGELRPYNILYFLADDTISVKEVNDKNSGRDPFPLLLRKMKVPKVYTDIPVTYPSVYMEKSDAEVTEYYQPKDLQVGETIYILGRRMLLVDCDRFTRDYYQKALCIQQKPAIPYKPKPKEPPPRPVPPHDGLGTLEDSIQNTKYFLPQPPRKDVVRQLLNANKYLRYIMKIDVVHPEDEVRRFILRYSLSEGTCYIYEPVIRNSGIWGGKYLRDSFLVKPGSDPLNPVYYTPVDFYIGATIIVHHQRFIIIDADLYVYRYMQANPEKFPCDVIDNIRNHMFKSGFLTEDIRDEVEKESQAQKKAARDAIGEKVEYPEPEMDKCLMKLRGTSADTDPEYATLKRAQLLQEYEDSLIHKNVVPEHGIMDTNLTCAYPVVIGEKPDIVCRGTDVGPDAFTPKHIDTPEEIQQKHYADVLRKERDLCKYGKPIVCQSPEDINRPPADKKPLEESVPIMVSPVDRPKDACKVKSVHFEDDDKRCQTYQDDLCDLKRERIFSECTPYKKC
uniref:DM10 domain-containing protein n=3 Tax=Photinus pyralis TaxID=7054 RepID=A0A1Y1MR06_PHOPY